MGARFFVVPLLAFVLSMTVLAPSRAEAHCEVPCGIYGDDARFTMLDEHASTILKAMKQIVALSAAEDGSRNYNQLARWVATKEAHADKIVEILSHYFLMQRIKAPVAAKLPDASAFEKASQRYQKLLAIVHGMLVKTMHCKQTTDTANVESLTVLTKQLHELYGHH